jgi:uncharacterized protein (TIGR00288 family)
MEDKKIALLIDSDNISYKYLSGILEELSQYGVTTYRRIYGDFTSPTHAHWNEKLLQYSIIPMQQFSNTTGKNATDSALIIDAMDLLYNGNVDIFCIVSSDSDFTRLAVRLRESGRKVIGMGEKKTPESFRAACTIFTELENLLENEAADSGMTKEAIVSTIINIITQNDNKGKVTGNGEIGSKLQNKYPDFDIRTFGYSQLSKFLNDIDGIEVAKDGMSVRLKGNKNADTIEDEIVGIVRSHGNKPLAMSTLGQEIRKRHKDFNVKLYGYSQLYKFIETIPELMVIKEKTDRKVILRKNK